MQCQRGGDADSAQGQKGVCFFHNAAGNCVKINIAGSAGG